MAKILIVEDEAKLAKGLVFNLELEGYQVDAVESAEEALEKFPSYDLMVLDVMLPGMSGIELLEQVRRIDYKYPVLILSARASEQNVLEGLEKGADDYITKPFSLPELILRVKRMLERRVWYNGETDQEGTCRFGECSINFNTFEALTPSGKVKLTQYECYVMKYLIENQDRVVSRDELLEKVWGYSVAPETRTVDIFIARLRKLFEPNPKKPEHIRSVRGVGYRFYG